VREDEDLSMVKDQDLYIYVDRNNPGNAARLVLFIRVIGILLHCERASFNVVICYDNEKGMYVASGLVERNAIERSEAIFLFNYRAAIVIIIISVVIQEEMTEFLYGGSTDADVHRLDADYGR